MPDDAAQQPPIVTDEHPDRPGSTTLYSNSGQEAPGDPFLDAEIEDLKAELAAIEEPTFDGPHAQVIGPVDTHSVRVETPPPPAVQVKPQPKPGIGVPAPPAVTPGKTTDAVAAAKPMAAATKQATQAAVSTAKQATQQVTAAVQNRAQKITVAPRKAIYRGKRFMAVYGVLVGMAGILAVMARRHRYFPADVGITRAIQRPGNEAYEDLMTAVSQLGWKWISVGMRVSATALMWAAGFRMESAFTLSTWSGDMLTIMIKHPVNRPRPTKDLVRVVSSLTETSFPSGHVVHYVTFYGFLFYLVFIYLKQKWFRTALLTLLAGVILLVGPSRIYMGHHWPSDVGGAYLVGTLWLGLLIIAYTETKSNYTLHTHPPFFVKRPATIK